MQAGPPPDWGALPADLLQLVFRHALAQPPAPSAGLPLPLLVRQWFALARTCKPWRDALQGVPLAVELSAAPAACLAWLAARPVRLLHIASSAEAGLALALEDRVFSGALATEQEADVLQDDSITQLRNAERSSQEKEAFQAERSIARGPAMHSMFPWEAAAAGQAVSLDSMMRELEGVLDEGSPTQQAAAATWSLATWHHLESLHLEGPVNWHGDHSNFSVAPLSALPRLHSLSLACCYDYELSGLPSGLRRLRLHYEPFHCPRAHGFEPGYNTSLVELPDTARLDELVVEKRRGGVAFEWRLLSRRCRRLVLHGGLSRAAMAGEGLQVGIGVPMPLEQADLWDVLTQRHSERQQQQLNDAETAVIAAWLGDFATSGDCLLDELCLGWRDSEFYGNCVQLAAMAPSRAREASPGGSGSGTGDAGMGSDAEASRSARPRAAVRQQLWQSNSWVTVASMDAARALRHAVFWHPGRLACFDRLPSEFRALPGLVSLVRQAPTEAPSEA